MAEFLNTPASNDTLVQNLAASMDAVTSTEQANFEQGIDGVQGSADAQVNTPATATESHDTVPSQEQDTPATQNPDDNPYAGMTEEEIAIRQAEEEVFYMQAQLKLKADKANQLKADKAKNEKLHKDYDDLIALVTCGDAPLTEALRVNRQAILACLTDKRIMVGTPQPIKANGTIAIHHSNNGTQVVNGANVPERKNKKITPEISVQCRIEHEAGIATALELATRYGVTVGYMHNVLRGIRGNG